MTLDRKSKPFYSQHMLNRKQKYDYELARLAEVLHSTKKPLTAAQLAKKLGCTRATIYNRLGVLGERLKITWDEVRAGRRGPKATVFSIPQ